MTCGNRNLTRLGTAPTVPSDGAAAQRRPKRYQNQVSKASRHELVMREAFFMPAARSRRPDDDGPVESTMDTKMYTAACTKPRQKPETPYWRRWAPIKKGLPPRTTPFEWFAPDKPLRSARAN